MPSDDMTPAARAERVTFAATAAAANPLVPAAMRVALVDAAELLSILPQLAGRVESLERAIFGGERRAK